MIHRLAGIMIGATLLATQAGASGLEEALAQCATIGNDPDAAQTAFDGAGWTKLSPDSHAAHSHAMALLSLPSEHATGSVADLNAALAAERATSAAILDQIIARAPAPFDALMGVVRASADGTVAEMVWTGIDLASGPVVYQTCRITPPPGTSLSGLESAVLTAFGSPDLDRNEKVAGHVTTVGLTDFDAITIYVKALTATPDTSFGGNAMTTILKYPAQSQ